MHAVHRYCRPAHALAAMFPCPSPHLRRAPGVGTREARSDHVHVGVWAAHHSGSHARELAGALHQPLLAHGAGLREDQASQMGGRLRWQLRLERVAAAVGAKG